MICEFFVKILTLKKQLRKGVKRVTLEYFFFSQYVYCNRVQNLGLMNSFLASFVFCPQYGKTLYDNYQRALARAGLASRTNLGTVGAAPSAPPATGTVPRNSHTSSELRAHVQTCPTHFVKTELCRHCVRFPSDGQAQDLHTHLDLFL